MSTEYNLKKLRALCLDIHDEQTAILLRSCLAEFPIPVINDFFNGLKLNKPSGPIESLAGIENLHKLETIQFSMWSDFKDISPLINRLHRRKTSFTLNQLQIINS